MTRHALAQDASFVPATLSWARGFAGAAPSSRRRAPSSRFLATPCPSMPWVLAASRSPEPRHPSRPPAHGGGPSGGLAHARLSPASASTEPWGDERGAGRSLEPLPWRSCRAARAARGASTSVRSLAHARRQMRSSGRHFGSLAASRSTCSIFGGSACCRPSPSGAVGPPQTEEPLAGATQRSHGIPGKGRMATGRGGRRGS